MLAHLCKRYAVVRVVRGLVCVELQPPTVEIAGGAQDSAPLKKKPPKSSSSTCGRSDSQGPHLSHTPCEATREPPGLASPLDGESTRASHLPCRRSQA